MSSGFSSSGSGSNQAKEGIEDVPASELATGGVHSTGMSSSGTTTNQADPAVRNESSVQSLHSMGTGQSS